MLSLKNPTIYIRVGIYITVYCNPFLIFLIIVTLSLIHLPHGSQKVKTQAGSCHSPVGGPSPPPRSRCTQDRVQPASLALGCQEGRPCIAPPHSPPSIYTPWAPAPLACWLLLELPVLVLAFVLLCPHLPMASSLPSATSQLKGHLLRESSLNTQPKGLTQQLGLHCPVLLLHGTRFSVHV